MFIPDHACARRAVRARCVPLPAFPTRPQTQHPFAGASVTPSAPATRALPTRRALRYLVFWKSGIVGGSAFHTPCTRLPLAQTTAPAPGGARGAPGSTACFRAPCRFALPQGEHGSLPGILPSAPIRASCPALLVQRGLSHWNSSTLAHCVLVVGLEGPAVDERCGERGIFGDDVTVNVQALEAQVYRADGETGGVDGAAGDCCGEEDQRSILFS